MHKWVKLNQKDLAEKFKASHAKQVKQAELRGEPLKSNDEPPINEFDRSNCLVQTDKPNEMIELDSELGKWLGFTSDKFSGYLWKVGDEIYISFIVSEKPNQGNLNKLFESIWSHGWTVKIPTPFLRMESICRRKGFEHTVEFDPHSGDYINVWVKKPYDMEANRQQSDADCANTP